MLERKKIGKLIVELCNIDQGLTNWEMEFIDRMAKRFKEEKSFNSLMINKMYEILNKKG